MDTSIGVIVWTRDECHSVRQGFEWYHNNGGVENVYKEDGRYRNTGTGRGWVGRFESSFRERRHLRSD